MEALKIAVTCVVAAVLYGIVHDPFTARICIEYFTFSHAVSNVARDRMGNRCDLVGRSVLRRTNDPRSTGWLPPGVTSIGTLALHRVFACLYGCQRSALRYHWVCTCSKGSARYALANVLRFTSDALSFHGGLVGTLGFLRGCFRRRRRALRGDVSQTTSAESSLTALANELNRDFSTTIPMS
jgi:hypothetical protein